MSDLSPCAGCGGDVSSDYKCPGPCGRSIHHFCGKRIGGLSDEPRHGDSILCRDCDDENVKEDKEDSDNDDEEEEEEDLNDEEDPVHEQVPKQAQCPKQADNGKGLALVNFDKI
jgi:hypothetical protein